VRPRGSVPSPAGIPPWGTTFPELQKEPCRSLWRIRLRGLGIRDGTASRPWDQERESAPSGHNRRHHDDPSSCPPHAASLLRPSLTLGEVMRRSPHVVGAPTRHTNWLASAPRRPRANGKLTMATDGYKQPLRDSPVSAGRRRWIRPGPSCGVTSHLPQPCRWVPLSPVGGSTLNRAAWPARSMPAECRDPHRWQSRRDEPQRRGATRECPCPLESNDVIEALTGHASPRSRC
jgi:hypothetical protein